MEIVNESILAQGRVFSGQSLQDPPCFAAVCWWKTEYDVLLSTGIAGDDKLCLQRSGREQERPQLAHLLVVLRSVKCSTIWPGVVRFCGILQPFGQHDLPLLKE